MRPPRRLLHRIALVAPAILLVGPVPGQSCARTFGPLAGEFRTSESIAYNQIWSMVARGPNRWTFAWSEGQDVYARHYSLSMVPQGPQFLVNETLNVGIQDEPAICYGANGTCLIAWS